MVKRKWSAGWNDSNVRGSFLVAGTFRSRKSLSPKRSGNYKFNEKSCLAKKGFFQVLSLIFLFFRGGSKVSEVICKQNEVQIKTSTQEEI